MQRLSTKVLAALFSLASLSPALSEERGHVVAITVAGTTFEQPPHFTVKADDEVVGEGDVTSSYDFDVEGDTVKVTKEMLQAHSQSFEFAIPAGRNPKMLSVGFTNDGWGGSDRPNVDRNLYILSLAMGGRTIPTASFEVDGKNSEVRGDGIVALYRNSSVTIPRPSDGWSCPSGTVSVSGFALNSAELSEMNLATIADAAKNVGGPGCEIVVSGYSSVNGPKKWNDILAEQRARAVAEALIAKAGIGEDQVRIQVMGSTREFGQSAENRRVVISLGGMTANPGTSEK